MHLVIVFIHNGNFAPNSIDGFGLMSVYRVKGIIYIFKLSLVFIIVTINTTISSIDAA